MNFIEKIFTTFYPWLTIILLGSFKIFKEQLSKIIDNSVGEWLNSRKINKSSIQDIKTIILRMQQLNSEESRFTISDEQIDIALMNLNSELFYFVPNVTDKKIKSALNKVKTWHDVILHMEEIKGVLKI